MCGGGGGGGSQDTPMADAQGDIAQEQWTDYMKRFVPLENELIELSDSGTSKITGHEGTLTPYLNSGQEVSYDTWKDPMTGKTVDDPDAWNQENDALYQKAKKRHKKGKSWTYYDQSGSGGSSKRPRGGIGVGSSSGGGRYRSDGTPTVRIGGSSKKKSKGPNKYSLQKGTGTKRQMSRLDMALMGADSLNRRVHQAQQDQGLRDAARYGGMTEAQKKYYERKAKLGESKSRMTLRNATRDVYRDRDMQLSGQLMGIGRGLANNAQQGLASAAGTEASRNATNMQLKQQQRANTMSTIGTVAGIAAMAFMSDRDMKKDIESCMMDDQIAKLNSMKLYRFEYKDQFPGVEFFGPMIDEVPEEFRVDDELNPYNLISTLIATVQQLQRRVDELENKE